jgi:hypothetical protein
LLLVNQIKLQLNKKSNFKKKKQINQTMGLFASRLYDLLSSWNEGVPSRILLLGLDGAGCY